MKRQTTTTEMFTSDDEQAGITIEYSGQTIASLMVAFKNGPKVLLTPQQLEQLSELGPVVTSFIKSRSLPLATDLEPTT